MRPRIAYASAPQSRPPNREGHPGRITASSVCLTAAGFPPPDSVQPRRLQSGGVAIHLWSAKFAPSPPKERCTISTTPPASRRPQHEGEPTLGQVMRRPQWIGALVLALVVAGAFAWLGQWQMSFAIQAENEDAASSEITRPLSDVTAAGTSVSDAAAGMVVTISGVFVPGDFRVIEQRMHGDEQGVWVSGHLASDDGHLAVAIGWARTEADAARAIIALESRLAASGASVEVEGRYMPPDGAVLPRPDEDPQRITSMAPAQLINLWQPFDGSAYAGFLVMHPGEGENPLESTTMTSLGLATIDSVPPLPVEKINWLNLFYAVEWVVFAGFAIYFWYRLTRDAWEKEHELQLLASAETGAHHPSTQGGDAPNSAQAEQASR